jgi:hypothetical protein
MSNRAIERNSCFGPVELGYYAVGAGSDWFAKHYPVDPPRRGYKIHVSTSAEAAEIVARSVMPTLRQRRIPHKVVRDLPRYQQQLLTDQRGKFITIYLPGTPQRDVVVNALDPELGWLGMRPGPVPTAPLGGARIPEERLGSSGFLFGRHYDEGDEE